jgi:hypothetical protein
MDMTQRVEELERALRTLCLGIDAVQQDTASGEDWARLNKAAEEAEALIFQKVPSLNGSSSLLPHSPSSSSPPSSQPPNANVSFAALQKKKKLTVEFVLEAVPFDLTLLSPLFRAAWRRWVRNRLALPKPVTIGSFELQMAKCAAMGERQAMGAIDEAIEHSWQTLYPPRNQAQKKLRNERPGSCL